MARRGRPELNLSDNVTIQFKLLIRLSLIKNKEQVKNWSDYRNSVPLVITVNVYIAMLI